MTTASSALTSQGTALPTAPRASTTTGAVGVLPTWPLSMGLAGYPIWWLLGIGDFVWPVVAAIITHYLFFRLGDRVQVPRMFGVWLIFLGCVAASVAGIDTGGRLIGFLYRVIMYASATVVFVYLYNARDSIRAPRFAGMITAFWLVIVVGGFLGLAFPLLSIRTPLAYVLPGAIQENAVIQEMVIRRLTQYDPDAWTPGSPRPSAPFLYTNGWGHAYAILTPIVIAYLGHLRGARRIWLIAALGLSLVPALLSLNRGMFIGLGVAAVLAFAWAVREKAYHVVLSLGVMGLFVGLTVVVLPVTQLLTDRLEASSTTEDRASVYSETFTRALESPVIGLGAPRPSLYLPVSVGTQGQVWTVLFSHGFLALALFMTCLIWTAWRGSRARTALSMTYAVAIFVTFVQSFFYGFTGLGLVLVLAVAAMAVRPQDREEEAHATS